MAKIRGRQAARDANAAAETSSSDVSEKEEEAAEQEAADYSYKDEAPPGFAEMKTQKETENGLEKVRTNKSGRSIRSNRSVRPTLLDYGHNPYDLDRVNTKESFRSRPRAGSRASSKKRPTTGGSTKP